MSNRHQLPTLYDADLRAWLNEQVIDRGRIFYQAGSVIAARVKDSVLAARCDDVGRSYEVRVSVISEGIQRALCTCAAGSLGKCKHVAAVLLAWQDDPTQFRNTASVNDALDSYSNHQLQSLIQLMLEIHPDLEAVIRHPPQTAAQSVMKFLEEEEYVLALATLEEVEHKKLGKLARHFTRRGMAQEALRVIYERPEALDSEDVRGWIWENLDQLDDASEALEVARVLFVREPSLEAYQHLKATADVLDQQAALLNWIREHLTQCGEMNLLARIYLMNSEEDSVREHIARRRPAT